MRMRLKVLNWYRKANLGKVYISTAKVAGAHRKNSFMIFSVSINKNLFMLWRYLIYKFDISSARRLAVNFERRKYENSSIYTLK